MKRITITAGDVELRVTDHVTSTKTGSHHHLTSESESVRWRVRGTTVAYMEGQPRVRPVNDHEKSQCVKCKERKARKGGTNVNHKFVCAGCSKT